MVDSVILKALGGDRGWNTLSWWNTLQLQDLLASAALVVDIREEAYLPAQPTSAHPADVLPLQGETTWEWEARTSRAMSDAANLIAAAVRLREAVPFMGEEMAGPAVQILQALTAWQESLFGGIHAVHAETQTEAPQWGDPPSLLHGGSEACMEAQMTDSMNAAMQEVHGDDAHPPVANGT